MGRLTGIVKYTADDANDYQNSLNSVFEQEGLVLISTDLETLEINIELV